MLGKSGLVAERDPEGSREMERGDAGFFAGGMRSATMGHARLCRVMRANCHHGCPLPSRHHHLGRRPMASLRGALRDM